MTICGGDTNFALLFAPRFIAAVLEAIAYRQQPTVCMGDGEAAVAQPTLTTGETGFTDMHVEAVWHLASTVMWLVWVVGAVAAAMSAKRNIPVLEDARLQVASPDRDGAQLVGVPVQEDLPMGTVTGVAQSATTGAPALPPTFHGMPVATAVAGSIGADGVCQGMPVRDESGNVDRPAGFTKDA